MKNAQILRNDPHARTVLFFEHYAGKREAGALLLRLGSKAPDIQTKMAPLAAKWGKKTRSAFFTALLSAKDLDAFTDDKMFEFFSNPLINEETALSYLNAFRNAKTGKR